MGSLSRSLRRASKRANDPVNGTKGLPPKQVVNGLIRQQAEMTATLDLLEDRVSKIESLVREAEKALAEHDSRISAVSAVADATSMAIAVATPLVAPSEHPIEEQGGTP